MGGAGLLEERLREQPRRRTVLLVGVVDVVRVELDRAVVEVEVRGLVELTIRVGTLPSPIRCTGFPEAFRSKGAYSLEILNFIRRQSLHWTRAPGEGKQFLLTRNTLPETVVAGTLDA